MSMRVYEQGLWPGQRVMPVQRRKQSKKSGLGRSFSEQLKRELKK